MALEDYKPYSQYSVFNFESCISRCVKVVEKHLFQTKNQFVILLTLTKFSKKVANITI